jgi:hypothetical protein
VPDWNQVQRGLAAGPPSGRCEVPGMEVRKKEMQQKDPALLYSTLSDETPHNF